MTPGMKPQAKGGAVAATSQGPGSRAPEGGRAPRPECSGSQVASGSVWPPLPAWRSTFTSGSRSSAGEASHNLHPGVKLHTAEVQCATALVRDANLPGRFLAPPECLEGKATRTLGLISLRGSLGGGISPVPARSLQLFRCLQLFWCLQLFRWAWPPVPPLLPCTGITSRRPARSAHRLT